MKKTILAPFTFAALTLALAGCGGEKTVVNEDPNQGVVTYSNGCDPTPSSSGTAVNKCLGFYVDYPIQGLNFDCSTDTKNHFSTKMDGGLASGACLIGDKVKFYIQGTNSERKISLGEVDLNKIKPLKINGQPAAIGLIDIAQAMTGKAPASMTMSDDTFKVMVGLVRVIQALALEQDANQLGDIQPIILSETIKNKLEGLGADLGVADFLDGSYVEKLKPWLNVNTVSESVAQDVAQRLIHMSLVNIYSTNFLIFSALNVDIQGFSGKSTQNSKNESIANMYLITDRQGYSIGYAMQWVGIPQNPGSATDPITNTLLKFLLLNQVVPQKLNISSQQGWINPLNRKITNPLALQPDNNAVNKLEIYQGTLVNDTNIAGTEDMYKRVSGSSQGPTDQTIYGRWKQTFNNDQLAGGIDIYKTNPALYLDKNVFLTKNTVKGGDKYYFPLYANIKFTFDNQEVEPQTLGIVIDENGDIRTNITSSTDLSGTRCDSENFDKSTYRYTNSDIQQYRIGTTGSAYIKESLEKSITLRMILANPIFGNLDGALLGLNETLIVGPAAANSEEDITNNSRVSGGIRLNLQRLINEQNTTNGVNITSWNGDTVRPATWLNLQAMYQSIYNQSPANKDNVTQAQANLAKRISGTLSVSLPSCYTVKTKS